MKRVLLIDGDLILYRSTSAVETEVRWDEENHVLSANAEEAKSLFQLAIDKLVMELGGDEVQIALTKGQSFRASLYPQYKAPRQGVRKPMCFSAVRDWVESNYTTYAYPGLEADDVLGIWATRDDDRERIVVSEDKDLMTIPGKLYRQNSLKDVSEEEADWNHMFQTLIGDTTDGYPGCPGVGPKTAEKLLVGDEPFWPKIVETYEKAGLTADDALTQARMARILRASDWNNEKKEPILWSPPVIA